jgi:molybdopterin-containing oxidoreductase family membrane subunit
MRQNPLVIWIVASFVTVGMWFERFVIIVTSLHRDFLPSSWTLYRPTLIEIGTMIGSFGLFFTLFLIFIRVLPMVAMWEIKTIVGETPEGQIPAAQTPEVHDREAHDHG